MSRRTPPKRQKASHEEVMRKTVANLSREGIENKSTEATAQSAREEDWVTVQRKAQKNKNNKNAIPHLRSDAIVITKTGDMTYADILRAVRRNETLQEIGENVSRIKKTAKREILLELKKTQTRGTAGYREEIVKILGKQTQIRTLKQEATVEVRDLDDITTKGEIAEAIRSHIKELGHFSENSI